MRALLSTRLFATTRLLDAPLRLARDRGFPVLELFASQEHLDLFKPGEARRALGVMNACGVQAPALHVGAKVLNQLADQGCLDLFLDGLRELQIRNVTADTHLWGVRQDGTFLDLDELRTRVESQGARLVLDLGRVDERVVRRLPSDIGLSWDVANPAFSPSGDVREVGDMLSGVSRGRLVSVRVAHFEDGVRRPPGRREASLLEEVWRLQAPGTLVYDVDDPSGFTAEAEIDDVLCELQAFHGGGSRVHPEDGGGLFWAALAPG